MALPYERNIKAKLWTLRLLFFLLLPLCLFLFYKGFANGSYFLAVVLFSALVFSVTGLTVNNDSIQVKKYFFFGLLNKTWAFEKVETDARFYNDHEYGYPMDWQTGIGCIAIFFPTRMKLQGVWLTSENMRGHKKTIDIKLADKEYKLLTEMFGEKKVDVIEL